MKLMIACLFYKEIRRGEMYKCLIRIPDVKFGSI